MMGATGLPVFFNEMRQRFVNLSEVNYPCWILLKLERSDNDRSKIEAKKTLAAASGTGRRLPAWSLPNASDQLYQRAVNSIGI
jgi:hypothetical protein